MGRTIKRLLRSLVPIAVMWGTGVLQAHPKAVWVLPVLAATGKGIRETWPNSGVAKYFPF